jgi:hypothetical protein
VWSINHTEEGSPGFWSLRHSAGSHDPNTPPPFTAAEVVDNAQWKRDEATAIARQIGSRDDPFFDDPARQGQSSTSALPSFVHFTSIG